MIETPWIRANRIAEKLGVDKKTVHNRASAEGWTMQKNGNRYEYQPPVEIATLCGQAEPAPTIAEQIKFTDLGPDSTSRITATRREEAVLQLKGLLAFGKQVALAQTVAILITKYPGFNISTRSLCRWEVAYEAHGIDGLVEQKQGRVGRKGVLVPEEIANRGKALVLEHGSVARAARELATHADLPSGMREHLHGAHASKSHVTRSIARQITPAPLTVALAQGPRHARLSDRFTPGDYTDVKAGDVFVSDDMTSNVICWTEWPNGNGWKIGQAQILPVLDVGSLRWLNVRVIMRDSGQYTSDDIAGLFGDVFDEFGLPRDGFVLEGGIWQSKKVVGQDLSKAGLSNEERMGGLASLGLKAYRSYDPRSKIIETMFNQLQAVMDAFAGYAGRDQRTQIPEVVKKQIALCSGKSPQHHPSEFFPHVSQLANHVKESMAKLNNERQDGAVLRGASPLEKWMDESNGLRQIPDNAKWLYRSAMSVVQVTKNGIRITQGTGKNQFVHYYDNPALLTPRKGQKVFVYWNDQNPEADVILMAGTPRQFIGTASYVSPKKRFSATSEELADESSRKRAATAFARVELRSIQPDMQRRHIPVPVAQSTNRIGEEINAASDRATVELVKKEDLGNLRKRVAARVKASVNAAGEEMTTETERQQF